MRVIDVLQGPGDVPQRRRTRLQVARAPGLLAAGAVLLMCAPVFPGLSRLVVLPAVLLVYPVDPGRPGPKPGKEA